MFMHFTAFMKCSNLMCILKCIETPVSALLFTIITDYDLTDISVCL